jgi:hypothetical protein
MRQWWGNGRAMGSGLAFCPKLKSLEWKRVEKGPGSDFLWRNENIA